MGITDFFQKKDAQKPDVASVESVLKEKVLRERLLRQQDKTAASKTAKIVAKPKAVGKAKKPTSVQKKPIEEIKPLIQALSTFYGKTIRKVYFQGRWYFFLEDVVAVAGTLGLEEVLISLRESEKYKKEFQP